MVYSPYPRKLESLTICRWNCKGSTFCSVILRPWMMVRLESNLHSGVWHAVLRIASSRICINFKKCCQVSSHPLEIQIQLFSLSYLLNSCEWLVAKAQPWMSMVLRSVVNGLLELQFWALGFHIYDLSTNSRSMSTADRVLSHTYTSKTNMMTPEKSNLWTLSSYLGGLMFIWKR